MLGGITVVLYGMIGLLGAKIWMENGVDFGNPINLVPVAAGIIIGIGDVKLDVHRQLHARAASRSARSSRSAAYHLARPWPRRELRDGADGTVIAVGDAGYGDSDGIDDLYQEAPGGPDLRNR